MEFKKLIEMIIMAETVEDFKKCRDAINRSYRSGEITSDGDELLYNLLNKLALHKGAWFEHKKHTA